MKFSAVVAQVLELLQSQKRVSYRALKREFELDDDYIEDLKAEIIDARQLATDEDGKVLVWKGNLASSVQSLGSEGQERASILQTLDSRLAAAERRQLTVMFCDLVGSTTLSAQLDPEELREVVQAYQETCTKVIRRYEGYVAQHLGDGLLVYFGYPAAHEDDAVRAVRAGLEIVAELSRLNEQMSVTVGARRRRAPTDPTTTPPLQVRIGIHTGLVVIGEIGSGEKREVLALGETPNIAARVQGAAEPDTVVVSTMTHHLMQSLFECQELGPQTLKGISTPLSLYRVIGESTVQSRFEAAVGFGLTPLVGREEELGLLQRRWAQAKDGAGQVVLLSGEAGIGKSRLVQGLKEQVTAEGATRVEFRCSPYHQNSALYPIIDHLRRLLQFAREDTPIAKLAKLQHVLARYHFPQADTAPLLAALLSLPHPEGYLPLTASPQKRKEKTQAALVAWLVEEAERQPVYNAWEDVHWADPSTLEVLTLLLEQIPTTQMLTVLTFRPEFASPWGNRSHVSQLTLSRLGRSQVEAMVERVAGEQSLPREVVQQIVSKTDGVPLFVEELTKTVVEAVGAQHAAPVRTLGIPATLQDALMARLDRLGPAKEIAQLGATLGREFSYELLHAVANRDEGSLQQGLRQLVEVELVYQRGLAPQVHYLFKHALIQDTAYQSLLKSRRQQLHQQIAQALADRFPETIETQPELLAHHYTEAGLKEQAIPYWQKAGQRAAQRSANVEAISHLTKGLELLKTLPDTTERAQQELPLRLALSVSLRDTKGYAAPEVEQTCRRALELCRQLGETPQLFPVLFGLAAFHVVRGDFQTTYELGKQLLRLAQSVQDPALLVPAQDALGQTLYFLGDFVSAREHLEQGMTVYNFHKHHSLAALYGMDPGENCLCFIAYVLWKLGYPDRALKIIQETLTLAQQFFHPFNLAFVLNSVAAVHEFRREVQAVQKWAEEVVTLSNERGFVLLLALGTIFQGWALTEQGQGEEGIAQIREGITAHRASGAVMGRSYYLALLAEACGKVGRLEEGLNALAEGLTCVEKTGERRWEAELYRLKGELLLAQAREQATGKSY